MTPNRNGHLPAARRHLLFARHRRELPVGLDLGPHSRLPRRVSSLGDKVAFGDRAWKTPSRTSAAATAAARSSASRPRSPGSFWAARRVNNGASVISAAALHPDIIAKLAFDPTKKFHFEVAGVEITNKIANPASTPAFQTFYQGRRRRIGQPQLRAVQELPPPHQQLLERRRRTLHLRPGAGLHHPRQWQPFPGPFRIDGNRV